MEKSTLAQQSQTLAHVLRAIWPCPDKDPQFRKLRRGIEAHQSTGHFRPGIHSPHLLLHMPVALQENLSLQHAVRQLALRHLRHGRNQPHPGGPILPGSTIATANGLCQPPVAIH